MTRPKRKPCEICGGKPYGAALICDAWHDAEAGSHAYHDLCEPCANALINLGGPEAWWPRCPDTLNEDDRTMVVLAREA